MKRFILIFMGLFLAMAAFAASPPQLTDPASQKRYDAFTHGLRCLKCEHQSIAESDSDFAKDVKAFVATQIQAGRSDLEIKEMLKQRFGDRIFLNPPWQFNTAVLWSLPFLLILLGIWVWRRLLRNQ